MIKAENLNELRFVPGHYHELVGDRYGQLACNISGLLRLIFLPSNNPKPTKNDGGLDWQQISAVENVEIVDYH